ncbi:MAG: phytoene/squalene synthase family protein [Pseudomonadota bacterium]
MTSDAIHVCRAAIATHSKSFSLASRLLPETLRDETAAVYAYCRRADDLIDLTTDRWPPEIVQGLRTELFTLYAGEPQTEPELSLFQRVAGKYGIPCSYPEELLAGMAMDADGVVYDELEQLLLYCFRVAGTVGLMMCHVLGVRDPAALRHAAHLGMAMQLTNICRDVQEDWQRGRLYLPSSLLSQAGAPELRERLGEPLPPDAREPVAEVVRGLLRYADALYDSGEAGVRFLPFRAAVAVRTARLVYADIGRVILARGADPFAPRAVVSTARKLVLSLWAALRTAFEGRRGFRRTELSSLVVESQDVIRN